MADIEIEIDLEIECDGCGYVLPLMSKVQMRNTRANVEVGMCPVCKEIDQKEHAAEVLALEEKIEELESRLEEEIRYGHRGYTAANCESSGTDCPAAGGGE